MRQKTILKPFNIAGVGLHTGKESTLSFAPALSSSGIFFIKEGKKIPALADLVNVTKRGTTLAGIATTEHLLAAVYGLGIDNLQIEVKGGELPALDGSALPYAEALLSAGIVEQEENKRFLRLEEPINLADGETFLEALPSHGLKVDFMVNFRGVGQQHLIFDFQSMDFKKEIAPARTFGYIEEYEKLKEQGLAQGASFENALVLGKEGYLTPPRFTDELVRHKVLDLIGDLALIGRPIQAEIKANKSGHKQNIELARRILQHGRNRH